MATKDWKAIFENKNMIRYKNAYGDTLEIFPEKINRKSVWFVAVTDDKTIKDKEFKSKPQAVAFAKKYMTNHPEDEYASDAYPSMEQGSKF